MHGSGYEQYVESSVGKGFCQGKTHFSRTVIAYETHGIDTFVRRSGSYQNPHYITYIFLVFFEIIF